MLKDTNVFVSGGERFADVDGSIIKADKVGGYLTLQK
jgi:hypothetical protein